MNTGESDFCPTCEESVTIIDEHIEESEPFAGWADEYVVIEFSCGHQATVRPGR